MAVRKEGGTGLEYTRSLTEQEQKRRAAAAVDKNYVALSYFLVVALIVMGLATAYTIIKKVPMTAVIVLGAVFAALLTMFILMVRSRRRLTQQRIQNERYPYTGVDKKSIDKIFDIIADEERKREKLDLFASKGAPASVPAVNTPPVREREPQNTEEAPEATDSLPIIFPDEEPGSNVVHETASSQSEEEDMASIHDDELNDVEIRMRAMAGEDEDVSETASNKPAEDEGEEAPRRKKRPADPDGQKRSGDPSRRPGKRPPQGAKRRPPEGARPPRDPRDPRAPQGAPGKKRRPPAGYDPYYGAPVYYDEYGRPVRRMPPYDPYYGAPVYYDEYGQPIRRREAPYPGEGAVYYDEYGRPVRRRPPAGYDARREDGAKRKRPAAPGSEEARRRPSAPGQSAAGRGGKAPSAPSVPNPDVTKRTAAPVAMPSLKSDFDEEYVPVSVAYDDDVSTAYDAERGVSLRADQGRRSAPAAPPKPVIADESDYSPSDLEAVPVIIPDDDYNPQYDEEAVGAPAAAYSSAAQSRSASKPNVPDYYYGGEDDYTRPEVLDAGVVVVHDFEDIDQDEYDARYSRDYGNPVSGGVSPAAAAKKNSYSVEEGAYSYDDEEGVVVLPRDENYEEYLQKRKEEEEKKRIEDEKKRAEERRLARKKSGKVALTIRKVRRKKIARKSRKYKRFRASVVPLIKYLSDYDD